jgi:excisionase family DNA binding protein
MTGMLVCTLDRDVAGHLAVALSRHSADLKKRGMAVPPGLLRLTEMALQVVNSNQQASAGVSDYGQPDDGLNDRSHLSRTDVQRLSGASLSTVDRWISSGSLRSVKHGRTRRVARTDLDEFLRAA